MHTRKTKSVDIRTYLIHCITNNRGLIYTTYLAHLIKKIMKVWNMHRHIIHLV